jgi:primosomal protein N' (replication factor Y)
VYPVIKRLIEKKVAHVWESLKESYSPRKETYVVLNPIYDNEEKLSELLNNWGTCAKANGIIIKLSAFGENRRRGNETRTTEKK